MVGRLVRMVPARSSWMYSRSMADRKRSAHRMWAMLPARRGTAGKYRMELVTHRSRVRMSSKVSSRTENSIPWMMNQVTGFPQRTGSW